MTSSPLAQAGPGRAAELATLGDERTVSGVA